RAERVAKGGIWGCLRGGAAPEPLTTPPSTACSYPAVQPPEQRYGGMETRCCRAPDGMRSILSQRHQKFDQVLLFLLRETEIEVLIVVVQHVHQGFEAPVVVETASGVGPQSFERRSTVMLIGRTHGLEIVDADLFS